MAQPSTLELEATKLLARKPTAKERAYLRRITKAWTEYKANGYVNESAMLYLNNQEAYYRWSPTEYLKNYWTTPPENPLELLGYATVFQKKNQHIHPLASKLINLAHYQKIVVENLRKQEILDWKTKLHQNASPKRTLSATGEPIDIFLVINKNRWFFQSKCGQEGKPTKLNGVQLNSLIHEQRDTLSNQAIAFFSLGEGFFEQWHSETTSPKNRQARNFLYLLLRHPELRKSVINKDQQPIEFHQNALIWKTTKVKQSGQLIARLELAFQNEDPIPSNAICLSNVYDEYQDYDEYHDYDEDDDDQPELSSPNIYLIDNAAYQGPALLDQRAQIEIPWESLSSEQGINFLKSQKSPIPQELEKNIETITPSLQLRCETKESPSSWGTVTAVKSSLQALGPDKTVLSHYTAEGWTTINDDTLNNPTSKIQIIDRQKIEIPPSTFNPIIHSWDKYTSTWTQLFNTPAHQNTFANWIQTIPKNIEVLLSPDLAGMNAPVVSVHYEIETQESDSVDWFDVKLVQKVDDTKLTESEIKLLLQAKGKLIKLPSGQWRRAEVEHSSETERLTKELGLSDTKESQRLHALQLENEKAADALSEASKAKVAQRIASLHKTRKATPPKAFQDVFRPYQKTGFQYLSFLSNLGLGGILADDMGLGKTLQALSWLAWLKNQSKKHSAFRALIVCPKSVMDNWTHEAQKFKTRLSAECYHPRTHTELPAVNLLVTNYTQLRLKEDSLNPVKWDAVILDEGQYIKNPSSQTARAACNLKADKRLVLTGTPIENRALDLWSLMKFAMPGMLGSQASFTRAYNDKKDPEALPRLARRIKPFVLRRTKGQVAQDLPERIEEELYCQLEGEQAKLYKAELKKAQQSLLEIKNKRQFDKSRFNILQSLLRLRQICCDPQLLGAKVKKSFVSAKTQALLDIIEPLQEEGHKILIFSQFVSMLDLLKKSLDSKSIPYLTLTGKTQNRKELIKRFQEKDTEKVFLLSLKAAGSGLNLTAASYVTLFDPWWNPATEAQAIDRTHRIGQTKQVIAYRLIAKNTIEEKIRALQKQKSDLANAVIDEKALSNVLTLDDIKFILSDTTT